MKTEEILKQLTQLRKAAEFQLQAADYLIRQLNAGMPVGEFNAELPAAATAEEKNESEQADDTEHVYALEDVRQRLVALAKSKGNGTVRTILKSYGAEKFSEVNPEHYAAIMKDAEEMEYAPC